MKKEDRIARALGQVDQKYIKEAEPMEAKSKLGQSMRKTERRRSGMTVFTGAVAAILAAALMFGIFLRPDTGVLPVSGAAYEPDYTIKYDGVKLGENYLAGIRAFAARAGQAMLDGSQTTAYSPTALYTALSMVTELASENSREALLKTLGVEDTNTLRRYTGDLWRSLCNNPGLKAPGKITIANSMWLNQDYTFNGETLQSLANHYYAASYTGEMTNEIPQMVSDWVKKQTNDLLDCQIEPDTNTIAVLVSAIYFYDQWAQAFNEQETISGWFGYNEKNIGCNYMKRKQENWAYYKAEGVTASAQYFQNGGKMLFILPDDGSTPADVLNNPELLASLLSWEELDKGTGTVNFMIPRFTLKSKLDLRDGLTTLGLGELFDDSKNPLPLLSDGISAYINQAKQGTALSINEIGCEAASYVEFEAIMKGIIPPEEIVKMHLSRPFVFAVLSENDVPLFLGVVNNPNG